MEKTKPRYRIMFWQGRPFMITKDRLGVDFPVYDENRNKIGIVYRVFNPCFI